MWVQGLSPLLTYHCNFLLHESMEDIVQTCLLVYALRIIHNFQNFFKCAECTFSTNPLPYPKSILVKGTIKLTSSP